MKPLTNTATFELDPEGNLQLVTCSGDYDPMPLEALLTKWAYDRIVLYEQTYITAEAAAKHSSIPALTPPEGFPPCIALPAPKNPA